MDKRIRELRYGKGDKYPVEFIDKLPKDKIVIAFDSGICKAYIVYTKGNGLSLIPLTNNRKVQDIKYISNLEELFKDYRVVSMDNLNGFSEIDDLWCYN